MRISLFIFIASIGCLYGCNQPGDRNTKFSHDVVVLDIQPTLNKNDKVKSSDLIKEDFHFVKLESGEGIFISEVSELEMVGNNYYIFDNNNDKVFVFNGSGKFKYKIDYKGNGPGEYLNLTSFAVSGEDHSVYVLDRSKKTILNYDSLGGYSRTIAINHAPLKMGLDDGNFAFYYKYLLQKSDDLHYNLRVMNSKGETLSTFLPYNGLAGKSFGGNDFYNYRESLRILPGFTDTIYSIQSNAIIPEYALNFGEHAVPGNMWYKYSTGELMKKLITSDYAFLPGNICETDNMLSFQFMFQKKGNIVYYNKRTKKVLTVAKVIDDLYSGFDLDQTPEAASDNKFISVLPAYKFVDKYKKALNSFSTKEERKLFVKNHRKFIAVAEDTKTSDNPILLIGQFK